MAVRLSMVVVAAAVLQGLALRAHLVAQSQILLVVRVRLLTLPAHRLQEQAAGAVVTKTKVQSPQAEDRVGVEMEQEAMLMQPLARQIPAAGAVVDRGRQLEEIAAALELLSFRMRPHLPI